MRAFITLAIVGVILSGTLIAQQRATPDPPGPTPPPGAGVGAGPGEKLGESVDRGLNNLGDKLRRGWADIRKSVDELGVQGRVYGRLHWDKSIASAAIEISVQGDNNVTLSGSVPDEAAHMTAVKLAQDTVGVGQVVDHLTVSSPSLTSPVSPVVPLK